MVCETLEPREIKRGLDVEVVVDRDDCFCMTSMDIRFVVPGKDDELDKDTFDMIEREFKKALVAARDKINYMHFDSNFRTGFSLNMPGVVEKKKCLNIVKHLCNAYMSLEISEEAMKDDTKRELVCKAIASQKFIEKYLEDITENGMFWYNE